MSTDPRPARRPFGQRRGARLARLGRTAQEIGGVEAFGRGDLDDGVGAVVVLHAQGAGDHRMHGVEGGDVGEFEDLLVAPEGLELVEDLDRGASVAGGEAVGVGEDGAFLVVEQVGNLPVGDGGDLGVVDAKAAQGLAVLGEDELALLDPPGAGLAELAQDWVDLAVRVAIDREAVDRVLEDVGGERIDRPPVARRAGLALHPSHSIPRHPVLTG